MLETSAFLHDVVCVQNVLRGLASIVPIVTLLMYGFSWRQSLTQHACVVS